MVIFSRYKGRSLILLPIVICALVIAGCAAISNPPDDPLADHSFVSQKPCAAPCWYGLKPGESSATDVLATLNQLPFVDPSTIGEFSSGRDDTTNMAFACLHPKPKECGGGFTFVKDKLWQSVFYSPYQLTFRTMVDQLGPPDYIEHELFDYRQPTACWIKLAWPSKGIYIENFDPAIDRECRRIQESGLVSPNLPVTLVTYTSPAASESSPNGSVYDTPWRGFAE